MKFNPKRYSNLLIINKYKILIIFFKLKDKPINLNSSLIIKEKKTLLSKISKYNKNKNIFNRKYIYLKGRHRLGNDLIALNNAIFFCEILGFKKIILEKNNDLYIKHIIVNTKINMTIEPLYLNKNSLKKSLVFPLIQFFYHYKYIKPENRFNLIKTEILNNLPKIETNSNDLYIHIRSGDIFEIPIKCGYSQPPLCFYRKILQVFKFRKVFIISENNSNPIINLLLQEFNNVRYNKNHLNYDISYLANSYNVVSSISSFFTSIIKFNDHLRFLWEYDFYRLSNRFFHLHYSVYNIPHNYTIYRMKPSNYYKKVMNIWYNSLKQRKIMITEKCKSDFVVVEPIFKKILKKVSHLLTKT